MKEYIDHTQFNVESRCYKPKLPEVNPQWMLVNIHFKRTFDRILPLKEIRAMQKTYKWSG